MLQNGTRWELLQSTLHQFVEERNWQQFHAPKNLAMAMIVEAAELVEHFQWMTEEQSDNLTPEKKDQVAQEIADTFIYLLRIADRLGIDMIDAAFQKIALNAKKYPVEKAYGSNEKYTHYE